MGLDKHKLTPCGFCFVMYYTREDTEDCVKYLNGTSLDDRPIRVDFDWGFVEGRQFGRGRSGGQVRRGQCGSSRLGKREGGFALAQAPSQVASLGRLKHLTNSGVLCECMLSCRGQTLFLHPSFCCTLPLHYVLCTPPPPALIATPHLPTTLRYCLAHPGA